MSNKMEDIPDYIRYFPEANTVFTDPVERYAKHLLPWASIDLSAINPEWIGWIHLVLTVEVLEDFIGASTKKYHNTYLRENWIGFKLNAENRYELLGDFRYFRLESPEDDDDIEDENSFYKEMVKTSKENHDAYKKAKLKFQTTGVIDMYDFSEGTIEIFEHSAQAQDGNWVTGIPEQRDDFPCFTVTQTNPHYQGDEDNYCHLISPEGHRFYFITECLNTGTDSTSLLFYEPITRVALFTFDYS